MRLDLFGKLSTAVVTNEFYECIVNRLDPADKIARLRNRGTAVDGCCCARAGVLRAKTASVTQNIWRTSVPKSCRVAEEDRQAPRNEEGDRGLGSPAGRHHAPHMG
jgi:hypothetical protein